MKHRTYTPDGTLISETDIPGPPPMPEQELRAEVAAIKAENAKLRQDIRDATGFSDLKSRQAR